MIHASDFHYIATEVNKRREKELFKSKPFYKNIMNASNNGEFDTIVALEDYEARMLIENGFKVEPLEVLFDVITETWIQKARVSWDEI